MTGMTQMKSQRTRRIDLLDRIKGCYLGKSIGGTLGMLYEGHEGFTDLTYFDPVPTRPLPNDDVDLQIIWLRAMQEHGLSLDSRVLGQVWLRHIDVHPDEYGIALWNLRKGLQPPVTGQHNNYFTCGMGAAIRSEIWACLFPGKPLVAAHYACQDASVDHWGDGVLAEMFMAALQSHLFESLDIGVSAAFALELLPDTSRLKKALRDVIAIHSGGTGYADARETVRRRWGSHNFTDCVMNLTLIMLGLLYGRGDFGQSLLCAVNCGEDADCTGATTGGCMGILLGAAGIPEVWRRPVGETIAMGDYRGVRPPGNVDELVADIDALHSRFMGADLPQARTPFAPAAAEDFSDATPWKIDGEPVYFDGIRLDIAAHAKTPGEIITLETEVAFPIRGDIQAMICSRGLFRLEFDGRCMGMKGDMANPVPSFHRVRGGRGYNLRVETGRFYTVKITVYPAMPIPDLYVSFGDMENRHLTVTYR